MSWYCEDRYISGGEDGAREGGGLSVDSDDEEETMGGAEGEVTE